MSRRRPSSSTALRILSDLRLLPKMGRHARKRGGSAYRVGTAAGSRRMRSSVPFWRRHRTPLALGSVLVALAAINLYVLYYRSNTSVPALMDLASSGRRAALSPRLLGPPGTPPVPVRPTRKPRNTLSLPDLPRVTEVNLKPNESLASVLKAQGIVGAMAEELLATLRPLQDPGGFGPQQTLTFFQDADDALAAVDYRLTASSAYHLERVATGSAERFVAHRLDQPLQRAPHAVTLTFVRDGDVASAVTQAGEHAALASRLAELFACEQPLHLEARAGDRLRVLIEKVSIGGSFYRYGRLLAAELLPKARQTAPEAGRTASVRAFLSPQAAASLDNAGAAAGASRHYFTESGESLSRTLCRVPLQLSRPPESIATTRGVARPIKPALHGDRTRSAVDFPAPLGAPVYAAAAGRVVALGSRTPGGLTLILTHAGGIETTYQHLSRAAKGLRIGQSVRLRQLVGFVGQTGPYPTGPLGAQPHLHFSLRVSGKLVDPLRYRAPREAPLPASARTAFNDYVASWLESLSQPDAPAVPIADARPSLSRP
ncbi:MAG: M23 family metallopeptidase [Myxococcales bacterium]|nr:M23 family metallopeptidase [Myxococcales bacterium]